MSVATDVDTRFSFDIFFLVSYRKALDVFNVALQVITTPARHAFPVLIRPTVTIALLKFAVISIWLL
jgi:hypothetical protein